MDQIIEQPATNIQTTIGHLRREDNIATALNCTMIDTQIEIGTKAPFYTLDPGLFDYCTENTRWKYTWSMARENTIRIEVNNMWLPTTEIENDKCIMETAVKDRNYQGKNAYKLKTVNQCRMYQQAFFISDLLSNDGNMVDKDYLDGSGQHIHKCIHGQQRYNGGN